MISIIKLDFKFKPTLFLILDTLPYTGIHLAWTRGTLTKYSVHIAGHWTEGGQPSSHERLPNFAYSTIAILLKPLCFSTSGNSTAATTLQTLTAIWPDLSRTCTSCVSASTLWPTHYILGSFPQSIRRNVTWQHTSALVYRLRLSTCHGFGDPIPWQANQQSRRIMDRHQRYADVPQWSHPLIEHYF